MMQVLFLLLWSGIFCWIGYLSWVKMVKHIKVYLMMVYNGLYLMGVFWIYPRLG